LKTEVSCSEWEGSACCQNAFIFFLLSFLFGVGRGRGRGSRIFFHFSFVPNMFPRFPMCSPSVFPIAPHFNPTCFAQSPPLLTYIGGPKGEALHLSIESSVLGSLGSFNFFSRWANQIGWLQKKKVGLVRHPQLINMKQNKYPQLLRRRLQYICFGMIWSSKNIKFVDRPIKDAHHNLFYFIFWTLGSSHH
jgi:hypothetical protein